MTTLKWQISLGFVDFCRHHRSITVASSQFCSQVIDSGSPLNGGHAINGRRVARRVILRSSRQYAAIYIIASFPLVPRRPSATLPTPPDPRLRIPAIEQVPIALA